MHDSLNIPLLRKQLEWAEAHPDEWDQTIHGKRGMCGTAACIAGHIVMDDPATTVVWNAHGDMVSVRVSGSDEDFGVEERAAELLGISEPLQSSAVEDSLFWPDNTVTDLYVIAADLTDGEIQVPLNLSRGPA